MRNIQGKYEYLKVIDYISSLAPNVIFKHLKPECISGFSMSSVPFLVSIKYPVF